jgi:hypothetical protein
MFTRRFTTLAAIGFGLAGILSASLAGQQPTKPMGHEMPMPGAAAGARTMTTAQKIANAMSAAPSSISAKATVLDWPAKEGAMPTSLRSGSNGWTCLPDMPETTGNDPMCVDAPWMKWFEDYLAHKTPALTRAGVGYMLGSGGAWGSNSDPYAMKEAPDNHWGHHLPHVMVLVPDLKSLEGISADPGNGGPYVMFPGTPYAHLMVPTAERK